MSIWAKRVYFDHSFASCWDELIQLSSEGIVDLMMVQSIEFKDGAATVAIYIRLPDERLLRDFPDFSPIEEQSLPEKAALLYGDLQEFQAKFSPMALP
jgi:hypothetical protein